MDSGYTKANNNNLPKVHDYFDKYTFLGEMYEEDEIKELVLNFFPFDNSVQLIDVKKGKNLLRRMQLPPLKLSMLKTGNIVNIFSKLIYIKDCAPLTRRTIFHRHESTFAMIKPCPPSEHGKIITFIIKNGFRIDRIKNAKLSKEFATALYEYNSGSSTMPLVQDYVTSGEVIGLELVAPDCVQKWRTCLGATDPAKAAPGTLRRIFGKNILHNGGHGCNSVEDAAAKIKWFFGYEKGVPILPYRATYKDCTCCIIKPHALEDEHLGAILEHINTAGGFYVSAMAMFSVKLRCSREFYEVYKGVLPEYEAMSIHLAEGRCVALEVKHHDPKVNVVCAFRKLCGPNDPDLCRQLYPDTIRAKFGKTVVYNAVHCTDLPEDGALEVEYFFKLIAND